MFKISELVVATFVLKEMMTEWGSTLTIIGLLMGESAEMRVS